MKSSALFATLALLSGIASAQTPGVPPEQAPAGDPTKFEKPHRMPKMDKAAPAEKKPTTKSERRAARKAKREAKVGDKPIN